MKQDLSPAEKIDRGIGARLRHVRKLRGLTQAQLGETLGVTFQQIQKYERGSNRISTSALILLARALDVSARALLGDDGPEPPDLDLALLTEDADYELLQALAQISSDEGRRIVIELVQELAGAERSPH